MRLFVTGAPDPEMVEILNMLDQRAEQVVRLDPTTNLGYSPEFTMRVVNKIPQNCGMVFWLEVGRKKIIRKRGWQILDHHKKGDPGFTCGPSQYWEGSTLGQVCGLLGVAPTHRQRIIAAADHCLHAAYRGLCPGVDPTELGQWRLKSRAFAQKRHPDLIAVEIRKAKELILSAPRWGEYADLRGKKVREIPEAAAQLGMPVLAGPLGRKIILQGATPLQIRRFMSQDCKVLGLTKPYGVPERGYAGAYML